MVMCLARNLVLISLTMGAMIVCGCSESTSPDPCPGVCDPLDAFYTIVFVPQFGLYQSADTDTVTRGGIVTVELSVLPLVDGAGHFFINGRGVGSELVIGEVVEPVQQELGWCDLHTEFRANEIASVVARIRVETVGNQYSLSYGVMLDSVLVEGSMCYVDSLCAEPVIGLPPNNMSGTFYGRVADEL